MYLAICFVLFFVFACAPSNQLSRMYDFTGNTITDENEGLRVSGNLEGDVVIITNIKYSYDTLDNVLLILET